MESSLTLPANADMNFLSLSLPLSPFLSASPHFPPSVCSFFFSRAFYLEWPFPSIPSSPFSSCVISVIPLLPCHLHPLAAGFSLPLRHSSFPHLSVFIPILCLNSSSSASDLDPGLPLQHSLRPRVSLEGNSLRGETPRQTESLESDSLPEAQSSPLCSFASPFLCWTHRRVDTDDR